MDTVKQATDAVGTPLQNFGVAVGMLVVLLGFLALAAWWTATKIVSPFLMRHFQFLDKLEDRLQSQVNAMQGINLSLSKLQQNVEDMECHANDSNSPRRHPPTA